MIFHRRLARGVWPKQLLSFQFHDGNEIILIHVFENRMPKINLYTERINEYLLARSPKLLFLINALTLVPDIYCRTTVTW